MYQAIKLSSGREVNVRPLTWEEYWQLAKNRADIGKLMEESSDIKEKLSFSRQSREAGLVLAVQEWDAIKSAVTMPEVLEVEKIVNELSFPGVQEGNS